MRLSPENVAIGFLLLCLLSISIFFRHREGCVSAKATAAIPAALCRPDALHGMSIQQRLLCGRGVFLNADGVDALRFLPGIGPVRAAAIVEHRKKNGNFRSVDEVIEVKGIGEKTVEKMKPWMEPLMAD